MFYEIKQNFITQNRSKAPLTAIGTALHETDDPGATDENEQNYFNTAYRGASAHAFIDRDSITQVIPWDEQAWHAGPTANANLIGIELCHYDDLASFKEVWNRAVWLFAWVHVYVVKRYPITSDNLMSHAEISNKWHETTHTDPIAYFAQFGKTVDNFRSEVQGMIDLMLGKPLQVFAPAPSYNNNVSKLQSLCNSLGVKDSSGNALVVDGIVGPKTTFAVCHLPLCGLPYIQRYATRYIQQKLSLQVDGIFGYLTSSAVQHFQARHGLVADGIVGPKTWLAFLNN